MRRPLAVMPESMIIKPPLISPQKHISNPIRVTDKSPMQYQKAVHQMAKYFRKEFRYDFVQYDPPETGFTIAYLWMHPDHAWHAEKFRVPCVGATCFRWREYTDYPHCWAMQWIWFHPFFRRQGLLSGAWPEFKKDFRDSNNNFVCELPLSDAMQAFLRKMDPDSSRGDLGIVVPVK